MLEQIETENRMHHANNLIIKSEHFAEDDNRVTEMEISVDPMMVLQNSEDSSINHDESCDIISSEDVSYLHGVDGEDVTIKLIRKGNKILETVQDKKEILIKEIKPFACGTCNRSFFTELALKNHSWTHLNDDKTHKLYRCNNCDAAFDLKSDLINHFRDHRINGMCQICGRV